MIFGFLLPLISYISFDNFSVSAFPHCSYEESIGPEFSISEFIAKIVVTAEKFLCRNTLDPLDEL